MACKIREEFSPRVANIARRFEIGGHVRGRALVVAALAVVVVAGQMHSAAAMAPPCDGFRVLADLGPACPGPNGTWQVIANLGTDLVTHGSDILIPEPEVAAAPKDPACVEASAPYHAVVIYAHPSNVANNYASRLSSIRELVRTVAGRFEDAATETGGKRRVRVRCSSGQISVANVTLPTSSSLDSFNSVVTDLQAAGYTSGQHKYWVWYEGSVGAGIAGTGHVYLHDVLSVNNFNNGNAQPMFAVQWGAVAGYESRTYMHELGHTMGAVQNSAPNTTGGLHCNDGRDVMCYADGAPLENYTNTVCPSPAEPFDCNHDDYFHTSPPASNYLATHWNVGSSLNRFLDVPPPAIVKFAQASVTTPETAPSVSLTVTRTDDLTGDSSVPYSTSAGTAGAGDFSAVSGTLTFSSGQSTANIDVPITSDAVFEGVETFSVTLGSPTGATLGTPSTATVTIDDAEDTPVVKLGTSAASGTEGTNFDVPVVREGDSALSSSAPWNLKEGTSTLTSGTASFAAGASSAAVTISLNDSVHTGTRNLTLELGSVTNATLGTPSTASITLMDDEGPATFAFSASSASAEEHTGSVSLTVVRGGEVNSSVGVGLTTSNGTALLNSDFSAPPSTVSFTPGQTSKQVAVPLINDGTYEGNETFSVALQNPAGGSVGAPSSVAVTIADSADLPALTLPSGPVTVTESSSAAVTVSRSKPSNLPASASWRLSSGATTVATGTLSIPSSSTTTAIPLGFLNDNLYTGTRTYSLTLSSPVNASLPVPSVTVQVSDDEQQPVLRFASSVSRHEENAGTLNVSVTRSGATANVVGVDVVVVAQSAGGADYSFTPQTISFAAGDVSKTATVSIVNDSLMEPDETFQLRLQNPTGLALVGSPSTHTVTIEASDQQPDLVIRPQPNGTETGNNVYDDGSAQTSTAYAVRMVATSYTLRLENDGNATNDFVLTASAAPAGYTVRYFSGASDVTSQVTGAGRSVTLNPGNSAQIRMEITPPPLVSPLDVRNFPVTLSWTGDGTRTDTVRARTTAI